MVKNNGFTMIGVLLAMLVVAFVATYLRLLLSNQTFLLANVKSKIGIRERVENSQPGIRNKLEFMLKWYAKKSEPEGSDNICEEYSEENHGEYSTAECLLTHPDRILYKFRGE